MRVAVMGAGAVGGYFGALLSRAGHEVTFVARGAHLQALQQQGLQIFSRHGDFTLPPAARPEPGKAYAVGTPTEAGPVDLVLFAVKSQDAADAAHALSPLLGEETLVLTLQNGVDTPPRVAHAVGPARVLAGVCYMESFLDGPGVIRQLSAKRDIAFGEFGRPATPRARALGEALQGAGIPTVVVDDARLPLWQKYIFLCAFSAFTTVIRAPIGVVRDCAQTWTMYGEMLRELYAVGLAEGVPLDPMTPEGALRTTHGMDAGMKSSMLRDLEAGKPLELDALQGTLVRLASRNGIPVPVGQAMHAILSAINPGRGTAGI